MRNENIGLYRDDGLAVISSFSGPVLDKRRKDIIYLFINEGLNITIDTNIIETYFFDVTFNLVNGKLFAYRRPNNKPLYINAKSNHPPNIINYLPDMISKRLPDLPCNEEEFQKARPLYKNALKESGHKSNMKYKKTERLNKRNRQGKLIGLIRHTVKT